MGTTAEFFDAWLRSQKKALEGWAENSLRLRQALVKRTVSNIAGTRRASSEVPGREPFDPLNAWSAFVGPSIDMSVWWAKGMEAWTETAKQMQQSFLNPTEIKEDTAEVLGAEVSDLYNTWPVVLGPVIEREGPDTVKETVLKLVGSFHIYRRLFEACLPLLMAIQEQTVEAGSLVDLVDPRTFKDVMDRLFGIGPEDIQEISSKATKLLAALGFIDENTVSWSTAMKMKTSPWLFADRFGFIMNTLDGIFSAYDTPSSVMPAVCLAEKYKEKSGLLLALCDSLSAYLSNLILYQRVIYETGLKTLDRIIEALVERKREGQDIKSFDDFFNLWIEVSEKSYKILLATEEFSKLLGELQDAALQVRRLTIKSAELELSNTPLVLRSEMEDLYRTMHDLKKEIKALKKERQNRKRPRGRSKTHSLS